MKYEIVNGKWISKTSQKRNDVKNEDAVRISAIKYFHVDNVPKLLNPVSNSYTKHVISIYASSGIQFTIAYLEAEDEQFEKDLQELKQLIFNS